MTTPDLPKPDWIRVRFPSGDTWKRVADTLKKHRLRTVCDEAQCPNKGECWGAGTAAFMILGDVCTRSCRFCAVKSGREGLPPDDAEGDGIARAVEELGLKYVALTSVDRDDLPGRGAGHFAACITAIKGRLSEIQVEVLIPDYTQEEMACILEAGPDVIAHNVETVRSLQDIRDRRASFDKSLDTLMAARRPFPSGVPGLPVPATKSSLLLGLGETENEVLQTMDELRSAGVDILVMGQYLQPTRRQIPVAEYIPPERFRAYAQAARERGFLSVVSSPFARTSYHAFEAASAAGQKGGYAD
ncbi:MAG: lipoyl synthase [Treponema sp.]|jgi:lipoic acid synthetase|nr:lipoyl synthase [Treponema sp.]